MADILQVRNLSKIYDSGSKSLKVLDDINFDISEGELVSIVGPSGSGKTTLLGLCAGLDASTEGDITLCGQAMRPLNEDQRAKLRNDHVGFIFQNFQLLPTLTAIENVMIPLELQGKSGVEKIAKELLDRVGLADRLRHYPAQLSGGEQQRVSIARAFSNNPRIVFADEPTGNLDDSTGASVESLLFDINQEQNTTMVIVTHDLELARKTSRTIKLRGGKVVSDELTLANS